MRNPKSKSRLEQPMHELQKQEIGHLPPRKDKHQRKAVVTPSAPNLLKRGFYLFVAFFLAIMGYEIVQAQLHKKEELTAIFSPVTKEEKPVMDEVPKQTNPSKEQTKTTDSVKSPVSTGKDQPSKPVVTVTPAKTVTQKPKVNTPRPKTIRHVVKSGDTLFNLSRKYYQNGRGVARIANFNGLQQEAELRIGTVLYIPLSTK